MKEKEEEGEEGGRNHDNTKPPSSLVSHTRHMKAPLNVDEGVRQTLQNVVFRCGKQDSGHFFNYDGAELSF